MPLRLFLVFIALSATSWMGCSGADARQDAPVGVEKVSTKPLTPTEQAAQDVQKWHGELATWHTTHAARYALAKEENIPVQYFSRVG